MMLIFDDIAVQFIQGVLFLLLTLFIFLILFVLIHRYFLNWREAKIEKSEERLLPLLYRYIDKEVSRKEFAGHLKTRYDIIASFRNIRTMIENLQGEQKTRLKSLLDIPDYKKYYLKKLRGSNNIDVAQACMYFEKKNITDKYVIERLQELQKHEYSVIGYSSTLALINTTEQEIRDRAIEIFLRRENNSSMAISDIIFEYFNSHQEKSSAAKKFMSLLRDPSVPAANSAPVVRLLPEFGLYELADDLFEFFTSPIEHDHSGLITAAIIEDLKEFSTHDITPVLMERSLWKSEHQCVRLAVARWMKENFLDRMEEPLLELVSDSDLEVRVVAQKGLMNSQKSEQLASKLPDHLKDEWDEIKKMEGDSVIYS